MAANEPKHGKSELLKDMLEAGRNESRMAGINTKIRTMVTEATQVSPSRLTNILSSVSQKAASDICNRSASYMLKRINEHSNFDAALRANVEDETLYLFGEFLSALKMAIMREYIEIENFILSNTYMVDRELFMEGFIRLPHQQGIDYRDPDKAHELIEVADRLEKRVEENYRKVHELQAEVRDLDEVQPKVDELIQWVDAVLASGIDQQALGIKASAAEVEEKLSMLRNQMN